MNIINYWFCITSLDNFKITEEKNVWGVELRYKSQLDKIKKDDKIIFYIKGRLINGIFQVSSAPFTDESKIFYGGKFPYRIKLQSIKILHEPAQLTDKMIQDLDVFHLKGRQWKFRFWGRTIVSISEKDFNYINSKILA